MIGIDRDMDAIRASTERLQSYLDSGQLSIIHGNFGNIAESIEKNELYITHRKQLHALSTDANNSSDGVAGARGDNRAIGKGGVDGGVMVDLGVSSFQIDTKSRGFAHSLDGPLDMRMNSDDTAPLQADRRGVSEGNMTTPLTAHDIVNTYDVDSLANVFYTYGNERLSRQIAREIVNSRPIHSTGHLKSCIAAITPRALLVKTLSKCFQAIRIVINDEMGEIDGLLRSLSTVVAAPTTVPVDSAGETRVHRCRVCVLSYHSLEDGKVKRWMKHGILGNAGIVTSPSSAQNTAQGQEARQLTNVAVEGFQNNSSRSNYKRMIKLQNATGEVMRQSPAGRGTLSRTGQVGSGTCWRIVNRGVVEPGVEEVYANTRSRSAKLRVVEFVAPR